MDEDTFIEETLREVSRISRIRSLEFDGYDSNNCPLFISDSEKHEEKEWWVEEDGSVWVGGGCCDSRIGQIKNYTPPKFDEDEDNE